ncbi:hypothetical protein BCR39DRAFT_562919 [Naematelia encephala]|uniref:NAD-dependent epimerase/dehydratase domain-containing protein n=1 Tax=Naematelia encephala TaxID=71784 RepID=A0A1Y2ADB2_9TREE|nr:hypothetical protein BCR39DRAFT_562919 [Naematelia encephala]
MSEGSKAVLELPVVLILGGTTTMARPLARYLLAGPCRLAAFVRIADRFSVNPPTTYLDKPFRTLLNDTSVPLEYRQVNLSNVETHKDTLRPPSVWNEEPVNWETFNVIYDLTGDIGFDKPELIQISHTYKLALGLARSAAALPKPPRAYIRLTFCFYEMKSSIGHTESADLRPDGIRGRWWHETLRALGTVHGLNVAVIRCAAWYGYGTWEGQVLPRVVVGHVYQYLNQEMKFLYNSDLRIHTIHTDDIAQGLHLAANYVATTPRETVILQSSVELPFSFQASSGSSTFSLSTKRTSLSDTWKTVDTVVPEKVKVTIPLFNVVDDNDSTQDTLAKAVAGVWGIKYGFINSAIAVLVQQFAKKDFSEMVDDVNENHVEAWSKMLAASDPPIISTPITPFLDEHAFRKMAICLDGSKAKRVLGFKPTRPRVEVDELKRIVKGFQDDGLWCVTACILEM